MRPAQSGQPRGKHLFADGVAFTALPASLSEAGRKLWAANPTSMKLVGAPAIGTQALNNVINAKNGISAEMALRLAKAFGGTAEGWLQMQLAYDLAQVRKREAAITGNVRQTQSVSQHNIV